MAKNKEIVEEADVVSKESEAKRNFRKLMEVYKIQNPVKFAAKKAELERKLAAL